MTGGWSPAQTALRCAIAGGPVVAVTASALDGGPGRGLPPTWLWVLVLVLSTGHAFLPESGLGTAGMLLVLGWWGFGPVAAATPPMSLLVAAAGLLAAHVAAIVVSYGPDDLPVERGLLLTWLGRLLLAFVLAPLAWMLAVAVESQPEPAGMWVAGLLAAGSAAVVASLAFVVRTEPVR